MTDKEIIKRLERCVKRSNRNYDTDIVLDLINRQKAEIERLNKKVEELSDVLSGTIRIRYAKAKSEAYKEFAEKAKKEFLNHQYNAKTDRKNVKIEELKEQMDWLLHTVAIETVENLLKEMVGEEK